MYKDVLQSIKGIEVLAVTALIIFIVLFVVVVIKIFRLKKADLKYMAEMPLESENNSQKLKGE